MTPLLLLLAACTLDRPYKFDNGTVPEDLDDGWPVATPESVGIDPADLDAIHAELLREDANFATLGLLVAKDGQLVFETYVRTPDDRDHVHHLQSATKSFTSIATGLAYDRGVLPPLDTTLCAVLGDACKDHPDKEEITLEHLLTMRSGIDYTNEETAYDLLVRAPDDPLDRMLSQPMYAAPGEEHLYRDTDPLLMAYALHAITGVDEEAWTAEHLFAPLGIEDWYWLALPDGEPTGAFGLHLRPRDFAKVGQTMLDGGVWDGQRVLSQEWIALATTEREPDAWGDLGYAYYWWVYPEQGAFSASGHGGQYAFWVPEQDLLVVQVAMPDGELHGSQPPDLIELIGPLLE